MASKACMERAPISADYTPRGRYETIAGLKTYVVGPEDAGRAIVDVYDVFGIAPQTLQGADQLAALVSALVVVPDFFEGEPLDPALMPANTPEKEAALGRWREAKADFPGNVKTLLRVRRAISEKWPGVDGHVGVFGLCWGGKIGVLASGEGNEGPGRRFSVSGTAHPGRLNAKDAEALTAPHICLASNGEPADVVAQYKEILSKPGKVGEVETYDNMFHGWMGARANLSDSENAKEYARGYEQVAAFFDKHL